MLLACSTDDQPSHLCDPCEQICNGLFGDSSNHKPAGEDVTGSAPAYKSEDIVPLKHHQLFRKLQENVSAGCHLCSLLWRSLAFSGLADGSALLSRHYWINYSQSHSRLELSLENLEGREITGILDVWSGRIPSHVKTACKKYSASLSTASTGSSACFNLASTWLYHCLERHPKCSVQDEEPTKLPARLLRLTMTDEATLVRLCSGEPMEDEEIHYLTLSHCWGTADVLTLTKASLESFADNIPLEAMPTTFTDAIDITLKLGFEYLWIDSLCIVQDDEEDWIRESANMGNIYRNGVCNIAALGARSDQEGCFADRAFLGFLPLELQLDGKFFCFEPPPFSQSWGTRLYREQAPLMNRAWVLQEVILSPRTIYYGAELLFWECIDAAAFECDPGTFLRGTDANRTGKRLFDDPSNVVQPQLEASSCTSAWDVLIGDYTTAKLSRQTDRWLAIAGLAEKLSLMTSMSIVAGMWKETLGDDILWHAERPGTKVLNSAPSWSWLSLNATIAWTREQSHERATDILVMPETSSNTTWTTVSAEESLDTSDPSKLSQYHPLVVKGRLRQFAVQAQSISSPGYPMVRTELFRDFGPWWPGMQLFGLLYSHDFPLNHISVLLIVPEDDFDIAWRRVGVLRADLEERNIYNELSRHSEGGMLDDFGPEITLCLI